MSTAARFRKKPVVVDAIRYTGTNREDVREFTGAGGFLPVDPEDRSADPDLTAEVFDKLHSTWVGVKDGQWIIRGIQGEFYPCDAAVFAATYEPATEENVA